MSEVISHLTVSPKGAISSIQKALKAKKVPMLHGSPALGKSSIVHGIAKEYNLKIIDLRLSQCEPQDMLGFPYIDKEKNKAGYVPMDTFPVEGDEVPKGYNGWLLFLDELTSASPPVQAAAYKIILDKMVGQHRLHPMVAIVGAGNKESDNAVVHPMSTALQSRLVHIEIELHVEQWIDWAIANQIDHRITDFIQFKPSLLYTFSADHSDKTYASPRTWHFTDDILKACDSDIEDPDFRVLASGCVSDGVALEFIQFCKIYQSLPKLKDILMAPLNVSMPGEPSILYALSGMIGNAMDETNAENLLKFMGTGMPIEFQIITMRYVLKLKGRDIAKKCPAILQWVMKNGEELFK